MLKSTSLSNVLKSSARLKDTQRIQEWMKNFGLFDGEIVRYVESQNSHLKPNSIQNASSYIRIDQLSDSLFTYAHREYSLGFKMHPRLFYSGMQMGVPGVARLVLESLDKSIPFPLSMILLASAHEPDGIVPSNYGIEIYDERLNDMDKRKLIRFDGNKVYPTAITHHIFSEPIITSFNELAKWEHKSRVFRDHEGPKVY